MTNLTLLTIDDAKNGSYLRPGSYDTFSFNVTIPANSSEHCKLSVKLRLTYLLYYSRMKILFEIASSFGNGSSGLHIDKLVLKHTGQNVQCIYLNETCMLYNSTIIPPITYMDYASVDLSYLVNTGDFSIKNNKI